METHSIAKKLLEDTSAYHASLVEQARGVSRLREIFEFMVECLSFAEKYLPASVVGSWTDGQVGFQELVNRTSVMYTSPFDAARLMVQPSTDTGGTILTGTFGLLADNYRHLEDSASRDEFGRLSQQYRGILAGPESEVTIYHFLGSVDEEAQGKFDHSLKAFHALPQDEDAQGPLLEMRSAIDLALKGLIDRCGLTKRERGDLKKVDLLPTIASSLAKDELAKVDLILVNGQLERLKSQLAASKEMKVPRAQADALMSQAVAILKLIASSIKEDT